MFTKEEQKCPLCKGQGYIQLDKKRILAAPKYTHIKCGKCNGTGKTNGKSE